MAYDGPYDIAKRKIDCSLDVIVIEYLKKAKCEKSIQLLGIEHSGESDHSELLTKFIKFLKKTEKKRENRNDEDLGFEINFAAFQPEEKVSFLPRSLFSREFSLLMHKL